MDSNPVRYGWVMTHRFSRRSALFAGLGLALAPRRAVAFAPSEDELFGISLAEWSLHRTIGRGELDPFDFIRTIAVAKILMPQSHIRLSAGREEMNDEMHALAYFAGANSIFYGEKLLTTANPEANEDMQLFGRLGIKPEERDVEHCDEEEEGRLLEQVQHAENDKFFYDAAQG